MTPEIIYRNCPVCLDDNAEIGVLHLRKIVLHLRIFISKVAQFSTLHLRTITFSQFENCGQLKGI